jgi:hypothetical protein
VKIPYVVNFAYLPRGGKVLLCIHHPSDPSLGEGDLILPNGEKHIVRVIEIIRYRHRPTSPPVMDFAAVIEEPKNLLSIPAKSVLESPAPPLVVEPPPRVRDTGERYFVTAGNSPEREVSLSEFIAAEHAAGFAPRDDGMRATSGFSTRNVAGRVLAC